VEGNEPFMHHKPGDGEVPVHGLILVGACWGVELCRSWLPSTRFALTLSPA